jgi:hypothetical protein
MTLTIRPVHYAAIAEKANFSSEKGEIGSISVSRSVFTFRQDPLLRRYE